MNWVPVLDLARCTYPSGVCILHTFKLPVEATTIRTAFTLSEEDAADATKSIMVVCDRFDIPSQTWVLDHDYGWRGGRIDHKTGKFYNPIVYGVKDEEGIIKGRKLRITFTSNTFLTTAILVEVS